MWVPFAPSRNGEACLEWLSLQLQSFYLVGVLSHKFSWCRQCFWHIPPWKNLLELGLDCSDARLLPFFFRSIDYETFRSEHSKLEDWSKSGPHLAVGKFQLHFRFQCRYVWENKLKLCDFLNISQQSSWLHLKFNEIINFKTWDFFFHGPVLR
jgi:hypothetical protein